MYIILYIYIELCKYTQEGYADTQPPPKKKKCEKLAKFTGKMRIDLTMIF